jgi:hypothetical protein
MPTYANKGFSRWTNDGDKMLRRKEILPGHILSLPKKEEIEKS